MESITGLPIKLSSAALKLLSADNSVQDLDVTFVELPAVYITLIGQVPVGLGGSAVVKKAILRAEDTSFISVALKVPHLPRTGTENTLRRLRHEFKCCCYLLPGHAHIAPLLGFLGCSSTPQLIFPWYSNATISEYLNNHPAVDLLSLILDVASGVQFMHALGIVHGDLKGANIMIDVGRRARLIDFGLSHILTDTQDESGYQPSGASLCWCAPELLVEGSLRTKSSDIYAFGSTILGLLTGSHPYSSLPNELQRFYAVYSGVSPKEHAGPFVVNVRDPERVWVLLAWCWEEAEKRPEIGDLIKVLKGWKSIIGDTKAPSCCAEDP